MWWTAERAAAHLGVTRRTLYTYASRGWVRRRPAGGRRNLYLAADIHELAQRAAEARGREAAAGAALRWGPPVLSTAISAIDPDGPYYRGVSALSLVEGGARFEDVCARLWQRPVPAERRPQVHSTTPHAGAPLTHHLQAAVLGLAPDPRRAPVDLVWALIVGVARWHGAVPPPQCLARASLAQGLASALGRPEVALDAPLVLCADHELNASTFAARVAAGTGADLGQCVLAALATWSGPRHGLASDALEDWLEGGRSDPSARPPGFGHPLYPLGDPRADALLALSDHGFPDVAFEPNLDAGLVAFRRHHGLPRGAAAALFAVGRCAGWLAHAEEQRAQGMVRPRARYCGPPVTG